jgi:hypothetical protein
MKTYIPLPYHPLQLAHYRAVSEKARPAMIAAFPALLPAAHLGRGEEHPSSAWGTGDPANVDRHCALGALLGLLLLCKHGGARTRGDGAQGGTAQDDRGAGIISEGLPRGAESTAPAPLTADRATVLEVCVRARGHCPTICLEPLEGMRSICLTHHLFTAAHLPASTCLFQVKGLVCGAIATCMRTLQRTGALTQPVLRVRACLLPHAIHKGGALPYFACDVFACPRPQCSLIEGRHAHAVCGYCHRPCNHSWPTQ